MKKMKAEIIVGLGIALIGSILAASNNSYLNIEFRGVGIFLVIIGVILIISQSK